MAPARYWFLALASSASAIVSVRARSTSALNSCSTRDDGTPWLSIAKMITTPDRRRRSPNAPAFTAARASRTRLRLSRDDSPSPRIEISSSSAGASGSLWEGAL